MVLIGCGEFSFLLILPVLNSLLSFSNFELYKNTEYYKHPIVDCLLTNLLLCLSFIPLINEKLCCNSKKSKRSNKKYYHQKSTLRVKIRNPIIFIGVIGILLEAINLLHSIYSNKLAFQTGIFMNDYVFELSSIVLASKILEKTLIYKHHQISIIFIFILGIFFYVIDIYNNDYDFILIALILKQILYGICIIFIKHFTEMKNYSIFKMLLIFGIVGLFFDLFVLIITSNFHCNFILCKAFYQKEGEKCKISGNIQAHQNNENNTTITSFEKIIDFINYNNNDNDTDHDIDNKNNTNYVNLNNCLYLDNLMSFIKDVKNRYNGLSEYPKPHGSKFMIVNIIYRMFSILETFFLIIIIEKLEPTYTYFTSILLTIFSKTKDLFYVEFDIHKRFLILIQLGIILFALLWSLIYNEIIELKFCGLDEDTRKNKMKRDDLEERRKSEWVINKGNSDADATLVDDSNNIYELSNNNEGNFSDSACTLAPVNN